MADNSDDDVRVSSAIYNLAGPESGRVDYLKSLLIGALARHSSITDTIKSGYLHGPAVRYWNFLNWAQNDPDFLSTFGVTSGKFGSSPSVDFEVVKTSINAVLAGSGVEVDSIERADVDSGKVRFWVLRYAAENDPDLPVPRPSPPYSGDNTYTYDSGLNQVTILRPGSVVETFSPGTPSFDPAVRYLYAKFTPCIPAFEHAISYGSTDTLADGDPDPTFPSPWLRMDDCTAGVQTATVTAHDELDRTYSDARPPVHVDYAPFDTDVSEPTKYDHYIENSGPLTDTDGSQYSIRTHKEFWVSYVLDTRDVELSNTDTVISGGVIRTDIITRTEEYLRKVRQVRVSTQKITWKTLLPPRWYIYQYEDGDTALDAQMAEPSLGSAQAFYPPIPFRLDNQPVGPIRETATRWLIHVGALPFDWEEDLYDQLFSADRRDVQVSFHASGSEARWVSLHWVSHRTDLGTGYYFVEHRRADTDDDDDVTTNYPLYRVFSKSTVANPGYFRVRSWDSGTSQWVLSLAPQPLLNAPEPSDYGLVSGMEDVYAVAKRAFLKAYGSKFDTVLESVLNNDHIEDIDFAYAVFGVSFNVKENSCRKYIFRFLEYMLAQAAGGTGEADDFMDQYHDAYNSQLAWKTWYAATHESDGTQITEYTDDTGTHHAIPPTEPTKISYPVIPWKTVEVKSDGAREYKSTIRWAFIDRTIGTGVLTKTAEEGGGAAEAGDLWWNVEPDPISVISSDFEEVPGAPEDYKKLNNQVTLNWQVTPTRWEKLTVTGMTHENHIYGNYAVTFTAKESVNWTHVNHTVDGDGNITDEATEIYEESAFIFPMHGQVYRDLPMKDATQMATACTFLVFNSYTIVEHPWYTSTWFKVISIIVIVVISILLVWTGVIGVGLAGTAITGVLGLGSGTLVFAVIAVLADTLTGLALSYMASWLATELFGEKAGTIVGAILGLALGALSAGGTKALEKLFTTPDGWMSIGTSLGNGTAKLLELQAQEIAKDTIRMMEKNNERLAKIQEQFQKQFGDQKIDPNKVSQYLNELVEKPDVFLQRTLMTGSDIVEATLSQVDDFVKDRLQLVLP